MELVDGILKGSGRDIAKLISMCEDDPNESREHLKKLYPHIGKSHIIGVTGPPGTGKSSLIYSMARRFLDKGKTVGVILVDPSSVFTGGAILGDRIRMQELSEHDGVYIRSMGSRGSKGGLSVAAGDVINILDASGKDVIIVETVGSGQSEIDIRMFAHTTILLTSPGLGDDIQALKAGTMEIADIFVVNKSDKPGSSETASQIDASIDIAEDAGGKSGWRPQVIKTNAKSEDGIDDLMEVVDSHLQGLKESGSFGNVSKDALYEHLRALLKRDVSIIFDRTLQEEGYREKLPQMVKKKDIYTIADEIIKSKVR